MSCNKLIDCTNIKKVRKSEGVTLGSGFESGSSGSVVRATPAIVMFNQYIYI